MLSKEDVETREVELKRKKAALKAWRTIRKIRRKKAAEGTRGLEEFVSPRKIASILHPELTLKNEVSEMPQRVTIGHGIIALFAKTPPDIACGPFWELRWAFGCPLNCAYCYLRGTNKGNMKPRYIKIEHIIRALETVFNDPNFNGGRPAIFNSGELCDSLMNPPLMSQISDFFEEQKKHKLLLLSKFGSEGIGFLLENQKKNTICAWSVNANEVAKRWEKQAPPPADRIKAAATVSNAGYETWIRIDPIFPIKGWEDQYEDLVYTIFSEFEPNRIILGTPRGLWKTLYYAKRAGVDTLWIQYFGREKTGWGKKLPFELRKMIYEFMYSKLIAIGFLPNKISICKETTSMWQALGWKYSPSTCKCYNPQIIT